MKPRLPMRVLVLAVGSGVFVAGLVVALLGTIGGTASQITTGLVMAVLGVVVAMGGAIGFAILGNPKDLRTPPKR